MTLFRLRLTTGLQTMGGRGPRASTVYESQVILSIKDTPLGLKFCGYPRGRDGSPETHRVFDWPAVVARPAAHGRKPQVLIQAACRRVRFAHFEIDDAHPPVVQVLEQPLREASSDAAAPVRRGDAQVQDLPFVRREVRDRVARDGRPADGDEERCLGGEALAEIVGRPGVREDRALDRRDGLHVSRLGGTDPVGGGHGGPPISPGLRPADHRSAPPPAGRRGGAAPPRGAPAATAGGGSGEGRGGEKGRIWGGADHLKKKKKCLKIKNAHTIDLVIVAADWCVWVRHWLSSHYRLFALYKLDVVSIQLMNALHSPARCDT